jgi:hypothetical protein
MRTIKETLDSLNEADRNLLEYAFQESIGQIVRLKDINGRPDGQFVGVNVETIPNLIIESTIGKWSMGRIKEAK